VLCCDLSEEGAVAVADELSDQGGITLGMRCDITSPEDCTAAAEESLHRFGPIDVLVANAGIPGEGPAHELTVEDWNTVILVNLTGAFYTVRAVLPQMLEAGRGSIVLQASIAGLVGIPNIPAYSAAKGGVISLGRQLAREYASSGIRVNTIAPGPIHTPLVAEAFERRHGDRAADALLERARSVPLGAMGHVTDVAECALFLASDASKWITGITIPVDGGLTNLAASPPGAAT
jgi:NAD(P)-dependent dehydrogenase (short-subunit alcohol dehydrogenase family)